jgi:hypothetical protein
MSIKPGISPCHVPVLIENPAYNYQQFYSVILEGKNLMNVTSSYHLTGLVNFAIVKF